MVNFQHHESSGFGRGGGRGAPSPDSTTTTQYGTSNLDHQTHQNYSSFDSCSCPGANCLYPLSSVHQNGAVVVAVVDPATGATTAVDPRYAPPLQEPRPLQRRNGQAFSTCTSLVIVLLATCLMLFLAHTFFSILYYGTYYGKKWRR